MDWTQVSGTTQLVGPANSAINGGDNDCASAMLFSTTAFATSINVTLNTNYATVGDGIGVNLWIRALVMPGTPTPELNNEQNGAPWPMALTSTTPPQSQVLVLPPNTYGLMIIQSVPNSGNSPDVYTVCSINSQSKSGVEIQFSNPCGAHNSGDYVVITLSDLANR